MPKPRSLAVLAIPLAGALGGCSILSEMINPVPREDARIETSTAQDKVPPGESAQIDEVSGPNVASKSPSDTP